MTWKIKNYLQQVLQEEDGYSLYPEGIRARFALCYPNQYNVGMSNLGLHIIYDQINSRPDTAAERFFLPDKKLQKEYRDTNTPLLSLESQKPLYEFAVIGFNISFELDYFNVLTMLSLGKVKLLSDQRGDNDPLVIAGGPCSTFNPEPLYLFVDAFIIGEGEKTVNKVLNVYLAAKQKGLTRKEALLQLANIPGVYVPSFYEHDYDAVGRLSAIRADKRVPTRVKRQWVHDIDTFPAHTVIRSRHTEFNFYLIETARGCGRHCRFCMAGYCFRVPRNRNIESIKKMIDAVPEGQKIGLMGAAISDYPQIDEVCSYINKTGHPMSVASFRADSVTQLLVDSLAASGQKTLTLAPEAGSVKIRQILNKGIEDKHLYSAMDMGIKAGIHNFRLYIMIGLPEETDDDIEDIIKMALDLRAYMDKNNAKGKLTLSVNPFVPKPFTPFQWMPMADMKKITSSLKYLKDTLKKQHIEVLIESARESYLQGILARGDRRLSSVLYEAQILGGPKAFRQVLKEQKLDERKYLYRQRQTDEILPWDTLDMGVRNTYLLREREAAKKHKATIRCFDGCKRCGVC